MCYRDCLYFAVWMAEGQVLRSPYTAPARDSGLTVPNGEFTFTGSLSESEKVLEQTMARIAPTSLPILLVGECGTGKGFIAHRIHQLSLHHNEPFFRAICSSLTPDAVAAHFGNPVHAEGTAVIGTLFLKEISELSSTSQRALLYSIPEGDCESSEEFTGPRLVSSTTLDLEAEVSAGRFRPELLYRLKGASLHLLPLRERKEDVPAFSELLLEKHSALQGRPRPNLDSDDFSLLQEWHWPGNIRELENVIKQMVISNDPKGVLSELLASPSREQHLHAPSGNGTFAGGSALKAATRAASRRVEEQLILDALAKTRWNRKRAAQDLQISYKSLLSKLKQIGGGPGKA
jgi:two-component system, NtrC family, response regulator AtoC